MTKERILEIDALRTVAIVMMVIYHLAFDLQSFVGINIDVLHGGWMLFARATAITFLIVSGITTEITWIKLNDKNKYKKKIQNQALRIFYAALLVSIATFLFDRDTYVRFGILHCIAISIFLSSFLPRHSYKKVIIGISIIILGYSVTLFGNIETELLLPFGIYSSQFSSLDYFPLFPWMGVLLIGQVIGGISLKYMHSYANNSFRWYAFWPGRHALFIYLIHQPLLIGIIKLFMMKR